MDHDDLRARFGAARVARLATVDERDRPHLVPVCFALRDDTIVSVVDDKPKTTTSLRRLDNVRAHPAVSALVDEYDDDDWTRLWWVRADGTAHVLTAEADPVGHAAAVDLLVAKYAQYHERRPHGPVLAITVERWRGWSWRDADPTG